MAFKNCDYAVHKEDIVIMTLLLHFMDKRVTNDNEWKPAWAPELLRSKLWCVVRFGTICTI